MITLNGILINDNMYLGGLESSPVTTYSKKTSIGGYTKVHINRLIKGRVLSLGSQQSSGAIQGIWCKSAIDQVKAVEIGCVPVSLNYRGSIYNVIVVDTSDFEPLFAFEPEGPGKKYLGKILMIEV